MTAVRTLECGFGLCVGFGPGNRHAIVGTKTGALQLFDLANGDMIEEVTHAHEVSGREGCLQLLMLANACTQTHSHTHAHALAHAPRHTHNHAHTQPRTHTHARTYTHVYPIV